MRFGYRDPEVVSQARPTGGRILAIIFAVLIIVGLWFVLNQKLILGGNWISPTYDNEDWRTNEGNLHTNGAWDIEAHIWKTEFIIEHFPNFNWNPYWYLGMPLLKYYQTAFYFLSVGFVVLTGINAAKSVLYLVLLGHLLAVIMTFILCYKVSKRVWASLFASLFLLTNTFITLRSYGWEPISVVFIALYPIGLLLFLREPLRPFRFWMIVIMAISYLSHPLIFFALAMSMGLYLFSIAIRPDGIAPGAEHGHYILSYFWLVLVSLLIAAFQFFPQIAYEQVTSGAHMGVSYIPFYHVPFNVISPITFFFSAGDLKGPGLIIMVAFSLLIVFGLINRRRELPKKKSLFGNELVAGFIFILAMMVAFYYLELYNIFPMNIFRSIQYHRIIPEFIVAAAVLISALGNTIHNEVQEKLYYGILIVFVLASGFVLYDVQTYWQTSDRISDSPEFIREEFEGRMSFPYTDQSLAVRNSFTGIPQVYGYYEQGITNAYADELFSVSSGYHSTNMTLLYLSAANVERLYINMEEGRPDEIILERLNESLPLVYTEGARYGYFEIPIENGAMAQLVSSQSAAEVQASEPSCRTIFKEEYCGSKREEFVSIDTEEQIYLRKYLKMVGGGSSGSARFEMINPQHYRISVSDAQTSDDVLVKMTYDKDFVAYVGSRKIPVERIGPDFILLKPEMRGTYNIDLYYRVSRVVKVGAIVSALTFLAVLAWFGLGVKINRGRFAFPRGDI